MHTATRSLARLLVVYVGTAFRVLFLGGPDDPELSREAGVTRR
ncbi:hypothetical protein ACFYUY_22235 [Kitasatospora sp. NPDC004745]